METPHSPGHPLDDLIARAREARDARDSAERLWHELQSELRAASEGVELTAEQRADVGELLGDAEHHHQRRRWGPAPS